MPLRDGKEIDTSSEAWRHECEVRWLASLRFDTQRQTYLHGVAQKRGQAASLKLRRDTWDVIKARRNGKTD